MATVTPFLLFDGNCAEAMTFYQSCLGGTLTVTRLGETPMAMQMPPEQHGKVVNARLQSGTMAVSASDWLHPTRAPKPGNTVCLLLGEATYSELETLFGGLSAGADPELLDPLADMPFGTYGHLADRYGVHWFFVGSRRKPA